MALTILRLILACWLPLSFDEAYYWLWSKHLALGYYEHPAAIALAIRSGTSIFGDTEWGVRAVSFLSSIVASWAVWRSAAILLGSARAGGVACLLFNVMLMTAAETMVATPDSLQVAEAAILLYTMAKLGATRAGRWWLAGGAVAGVALSTKYTGLFLCASSVLWLFASQEGRSWRRTPWPYAGALLAAAIFAPTLYWNATHGFMSFAFQFGRVGRFDASPRYLPEFLAGQIALASPFILILAGSALAHNLLTAKDRHPLSFAAAIVWPATIYFLVHSLHDRVQANWPSFIYPAVALLAAQAYAHAEFAGGKFLRLSRALAVPVAFAILIVAYAQAFFGLLPLGWDDPIARTTAIGFPAVAEHANQEAEKLHADAIVTVNYATTSWLYFYARPKVPIIQIADDFRFLSSPRATGRLLRGRLLYITKAPKLELPDVRERFSSVGLVDRVVRERNGVAIQPFNFYLVSGFHGPVIGRIPEY